MATTTSPSLTDIFEYLDELRASGGTNMFGATPYVEDHFNLHRGLASAAVSKWMQTFSSDKTAAERAELAA